MSTGQRVTKNAVFMFGKIAVNAICLLLSTRFVLQALGIVDFGLYNLVGSIVLLFSFVNSTMTESTQRFLSYNQGKQDIPKLQSVFNSSIVIHWFIALFIAVLFICLTPLLYSDYISIPNHREEACTYVYFLSILCMILGVCNVPYHALIIAHEHMFYYAIIGIATGIMKLLISIILLYSPGDKLIIYGILISFISVAEFIICRHYCIKHYKESKINLKTTNKQIIKEMFTYAGWQFAYTASSIISIQGVSLLLNSFYGAIMNAAQGVAKQVCGQLMTFSSTLSVALNPALVKKAGANQISSMLSVALSGCKLTFLLIVLFALPVLFELKFLLNLWLENVPDYALIFCLFEVIQQVLASLTLPLVTIIGGVGKIKGIQICSAATYLIRLPLIYYAFLLGYSPETAYYISCACVIVMLAGRVYFAGKICGLSILRYVKEVLTPCTVITTLVGSVLYLYIVSTETSLCRFFGTCSISLTLFAIFGYFIILNRNEKIFIRETLNKVKSKVLSL